MEVTLLAFEALRERTHQALDTIRIHRLAWRFPLLAAGLALLAGACTQGAPTGQQASLEKDARYWKQLTALLEPVPMKSMTDHRAYMLPSGVVIALHFDNMDLNQAQNLNWVALGIPGKNCKQDQERLEQLYGKGFTHFHDMKADTHGGAAAAEGVWFVHVGVREFDSPMSQGHVRPGPDMGFMPTNPPTC